MLPTILKGRAFIIQTDEQDFRTPAKPVPHMDWRGFTARHSGLATGTGMYFVKVIQISRKHDNSSHDQTIKNHSPALLA
jgi:imidazoleglycerol phosphate synthase glutamine amidotransferase subunit HisH